MLCTQSVTASSLSAFWYHTSLTNAVLARSQGSNLEEAVQQLQLGGVNATAAGDNITSREPEGGLPAADQVAAIHTI